MKIERNTSDEAIDRVLNGLAGVEASPEFEQRVLQSIRRNAAEQERIAAEQERVVLVSAARWLPTRRWAVAACLVVLGIAMSVAVRRRHEPGLAEAIREGHTSPVTAAAPLMGVAEMPSESEPRKTAVTALPHRKHETKPEVSDEDALAISEMLAPSKPAPPLPLTHQEKLLAEAVHHANPAELSSLRPEVRARQMELSKAEFRDFFEPPPTKHNE